MTTKGGILPPATENENPDKKKGRKSFVRVPQKRKSKANTTALAESPKKQEAIEAEVLDKEDIQNESDDFEREERSDLDFEEDGSLVPVSDAEAPTQIDDAELERSVSSSRGLAVPSALQRYLMELRKYPLMSIEEERATAMKAYENQDLEARNRLVTANLRLVVKIAMEYRRAYAQMLDLIQEGNAGLVQAVNRFNPYRGVKMSTYAAWWIRAYILKFLMDNKSLVRMGTTEAQRKLFFRLRSEAEKMYALTQRFDANLLAENIGVKESDVIEMQQRLSKSDMSLDAPLSDDSDARQVDTLSSTFEDADLKLEKDELVKILRKEVKVVEAELNDRDKFIFQNRIMAEEPITLQDVGDKFGITRERARQLEARVLKKIKDRLASVGVSE